MAESIFPEFSVSAKMPAGMRPPKQADIALKIEGIEQARIAMEALTDAAEKAKRAIADLQCHSHGGITIKMLGEAVLIEIKPPASAS